jgi:hypothetical protein
MAFDDDNLDQQPNEQFANDMRAIYRADVQVPASIDDAILRDARLQFARQRSRRLILRIGALLTAAAAVFVIAIHFSAPSSPRNLAQVPAGQTDVTTAGAVDIVDALQLAKRIRAGQTSVASDDVNHDGAVDQREVDAIAMTAVKLPEARVQ